MQVIEYESRLNKNQRIYLEEKCNHPLKGNFNDLSDVMDFFEEAFQLTQKAEEYVYLVALNSRNRPIGVFEISHGGQTVSMINIKEIFSRLLILGAVGFMVVHNHPSGDTAPSESDLESTGLLKQASAILGITMVDHIIIGDNCYSMKANGIIN